MESGAPSSSRPTGHPHYPATAPQYAATARHGVWSRQLCHQPPSFPCRSAPYLCFFSIGVLTASRTVESRQLTNRECESFIPMNTDMGRILYPRGIRIWVWYWSTLPIPLPIAILIQGAAGDAHSKLLKFPALWSLSCP